MMISQLREYLAEVQDVYGDIPVKLPAYIDPDDKDEDTAQIEGVSALLDEDGNPGYVIICDAYTLDMILDDTAAIEAMSAGSR